MLQVAISIGHHPYKRTLGASQGGLHEATMCGWVALGIYTTILEAGHAAHIDSVGSYQERQQRSDVLGCDIHHELHINAGGGNYGAMFYHPDSPSTNGPRLARIAAERWAGVAAGLGHRLRVKALRAKVPQWKRVHACIQHLDRTTTPVALLSEPFFIDNPQHRAAFTSPTALFQQGVALAQADLFWAVETGRIDPATLPAELRPQLA